MEAVIFTDPTTQVQMVLTDEQPDYEGFVVLLYRHMLEPQECRVFNAEDTLDPEGIEKGPTAARMVEYWKAQKPMSTMPEGLWEPLTPDALSLASRFIEAYLA